ncbi:MAG: hypothetical protein NVV68_06420 [Dokdonella sp.]|nr:hypothetical protein [Dokdonella sp.]
MNSWIVSRRSRAGRRRQAITLARSVFAAGVLLLAPQAGSQQITAQAIVSGGGVSRSGGGCLALHSTLGEPVAGRASGGDYAVTAGFTAATAATPRDAIFHDGFQECQ